jgi:hypothetical protein
MVLLNRKFKAPSNRAVQAWKVVEYLVANGYRFDSITEDGGWVRYPTTMAAARAFVGRRRPLPPKRKQ